MTTSAELRRRALPELRLVRGTAVDASQLRERAATQAHERIVRHRRKQALVRRHVRSTVPVIFLVALFAGLWIGTGALVSSGPSRLDAPKGAVAVHGGYDYVVQPGDTVWSIATQMLPQGDPRPLVDEIEAELHGGQLQVGAILHLP